MKQRLIGAAVIIALAVIFIPMLLEGPAKDDPVTMKIEIPEKPVYEIPSRLEPPPTPDKVIIPPAATMPEKSDVVVPEPAPAMVTPEVAPEPQAVEESAKVAVPEPPAPVAVVPPVEKPKPPVQKPASKPKVPTDTGFVVQVGSFSQRQNALVLSDKLAASGYQAFVESGKSSSQTIYRVKVGPEPTRSDADKLRQKLLNNEKLKGIIVSHP